MPNHLQQQLQQKQQELLFELWVPWFVWSWPSPDDLASFELTSSRETTFSLAAPSFSMFFMGINSRDFFLLFLREDLRPLLVCPATVSEGPAPIGLFSSTSLRLDSPWPELPPHNKIFEEKLWQFVLFFGTSSSSSSSSSSSLGHWCRSRTSMVHGASRILHSFIVLQALFVKSPLFEACVSGSPRDLELFSLTTASGSEDGIVSWTAGIIPTERPIDPAAPIPSLFLAFQGSVDSSQDREGHYAGDLITWRGHERSLKSECKSIKFWLAPRPTAWWHMNCQTSWQEDKIFFVGGWTSTGTSMFGARWILQPKSSVWPTRRDGEGQDRRGLLIPSFSLGDRSSEGRVRGEKHG